MLRVDSTLRGQVEHECERVPRANIHSDPENPLESFSLWGPFVRQTDTQTHRLRCGKGFLRSGSACEQDAHGFLDRMT